MLQKTNTNLLSCFSQLKHHQNSSQKSHQSKTHILKLFNQNLHPSRIELRQHDLLSIQIIDLRKEIDTGIYQRRYVFLEVEELEICS